MKILIVEDEPKVVTFLKKGLSEQGYEVEVAYDGKIGAQLGSRGKFDLILLDVILPLQNGYETCKSIREKDQQVAILMLTALGTTDDKLMGFDCGADDYLVKPFDFKELLARIRSLTKRRSHAQNGTNQLKVADLILDLNKKQAIRGEQNIELTAKEYLLLEMLMRNRGRVLTRPEIAEKVWEITFDTGTNIVDVYINILRKKIDKNFENKLIHTKIGHGYTLEES
ncbi:MAG: response regulator [Prolixibacteraceae bacterium]